MLLRIQSLSHSYLLQMILFEKQNCISEDFFRSILLLKYPLIKEYWAILEALVLLADWFCLLNNIDHMLLWAISWHHNAYNFFHFPFQNDSFWESWKSFHQQINISWGSYISSVCKMICLINISFNLMSFLCISYSLVDTVLFLLVSKCACCMSSVSLCLSPTGWFLSASKQVCWMSLLFSPGF